MLFFFNVVFIVIGLVYGQETTTLLQTKRTTLPRISTTGPTSTLFSTSPSESPATTTSKGLRTTQPPLTTKPRPYEGSWNVTEGNVTCIRANLAIEFNIPIQNGTIFLNPNASSLGSSCSLSNATQALVLEYRDYYLRFEFEKDATSTYVRNVAFIINTSFGTDVFYNDTKLFLVKTGNSYLCKTADLVQLGNATMHIYKIQIQAFETADETGFGKVEECELDDIVSDIIPIAVSCALAGLTILILIVYLICRKSPQRGYTSV